MKTNTVSGVDIELASPIDSPPIDGYMPCWVTIKNHSGAARTWRITCRGQAGRGSTDGYSSSFRSLRVEDGATVRESLLLPLDLGISSTYWYPANTIRVEGYGIEDPMTDVPVNRMYARGKPSGYIAMGDALAGAIWFPLAKQFRDGGKMSLTGSPFQMNLLGTDWRGLASFDCLWITEAEYAALEPDRRAAIQTWVEQGGRFYLCAQALDPALRAELGLPTAGSEAHPGYGYVKLIPWNGSNLPLDAATAEIAEIKPMHQELHQSDAAKWRMTQSVGTIPLNASFLILFICMFAAVVGPVNLFWLAGSTRRHRLFWTTPLISVAASLLLLVVIVVRDGFGGRGERALVALLLPDRKQAIVVQEQVSRTGVLISRRFTVAEDLILSALNVQDSPGKSYEQAGHDYSGDWFASRSVQAHRLEAIVPSRAEIQLLNADASRHGAPPVVASTIPAMLREVHYVDDERRAWRGGSLRTGERLTLERDEQPAPPAFREGSNLPTRLTESICGQPGTFYALADDGPFIDTLASIRWTRQQAMFLGRVAPVH